MFATTTISLCTAYEFVQKQGHTSNSALFIPLSIQATVSTITIAPTNDNKGVLDFTGGGGGDGEDCGGEEAATKGSEQLPPLRSLFDCSYNKTGTVNDGKDGWECVWCGLAPRHAPRALKHVLKIKITNIAICRATIPDRFRARYLSLFNADQVWWKQRSVQMNIVKSPWCR